MSRNDKKLNEHGFIVESVGLPFDESACRFLGEVLARKIARETKLQLIQLDTPASNDDNGHDPPEKGNVILRK